MIAFLTSCGRFDLLKETIETLYKNQQSKFSLIINDDALLRMGQHASIEMFLKNSPNEKYYLHLEDDWSFENSYDWIRDSIEIMENNPDIIKVVCRKDSQHPCVHDKSLIGAHIPEQKWGILQAPWHHEGISWQGFTWNPGVTRLDLIKKFIPFRKWEQDVAEDIQAAGYKVAELESKIYKHIGYERSTHE